jgi:hypothetical protein
VQLQETDDGPFAEGGAEWYVIQYHLKKQELVLGID